MTATILITGGTGKFGRQFVEHFAHKGWQVLFTTTSQNNADSLIKELADEYSLIPLIVDFTQPQAVLELAQRIKDDGYRVNHLVNNARSRSFLQTDSLGQSSREDFLAEYLLDVVVPYELSMALFNMQPSELVTITNIGSQYGIVAANPALYADYPRQSPIQYGVAKSALIHLTKELAVRFAALDIRVNCIAYGGVSGRVDESFAARYAQLTPSGRMLAESEIIGPLDFLISAHCKAINGQTIQADGGWTLW
ncbi:SDR family oxidoreductase [Psychrobacter sp. 1U2]|uniref:SDR family oxidoreductase n=1 Tax=Psychrobacter sp. 1U2 TaxID=3453577 RepID=UPI003F45DEA8